MDYAHERVLLEAGALAGWAVETGGDGLPRSASGPCPSCGHPCDLDILTEVATTSVLVSASQVGAEARLTRQLICNCDGSHARPEGGSGGCGRWWLVEFFPRGAGFGVRPASDESLAPAAAALTTAAGRAHERIRTSAQHWVGGISALYGVLGIAGIAFGRDVLAGLRGDGRLVAVGLILVGLIFAAVATGLGYRAAYGWPRHVSVTTDRALVEWKAAYDRYAFTAAAALRRAVTCATAGWMALVLAAGVVWLWPPAQADLRQVQVTWEDDSRVCGELLTTTVGTMKVRRADGSVDERPAGQVREVTVGSRC